MNYAATLAVLVVLAFCFPLTLRLGAGLGVSETITLSVLGALLTFALALFLVRWQVGRHQAATSRLEKARAQILADPENPRSYFVGGEHLGAGVEEPCGVYSPGLGEDRLSTA